MRNGDGQADVMQEVDASEELKAQHERDVEEVQENPVASSERPEKTIQDRLDTLGSLERDIGKKAEQIPEPRERINSKLDDSELRSYIQEWDGGQLLNDLEKVLDLYPDLVMLLAVQSRIARETLRQTPEIIDTQQMMADLNAVKEHLSEHNERTMDQLGEYFEMHKGGLRDLHEILKESLERVDKTQRRQQEIAEALNELTERLGIEADDDGGSYNGVNIPEDTYKTIARMLRDTELSQTEIADIVDVNDGRVTEVKKAEGMAD